MAAAVETAADETGGVRRLCVFLAAVQVWPTTCIDLSCQEAKTSPFEEENRTIIIIVVVAVVVLIIIIIIIIIPTGPWEWDMICPT